MWFDLGSVAIKPLGIFGGTFDPIHYGHLRLAEEMRERVGLGEVRFIPTGTPPHRGQPRVTAQQRAEMVARAIVGHEGFVLDEREVRRAVTCYTVDTVRELRAELGESRPFCLLLGGDAFLQLHSWQHWRQLLDLTHVVVGCRPGFDIEERLHTTPPTFQQQFQRRRADLAALPQQPGGQIALLTIPKLEISATDIRQRLAEGRTIRYLLPPAVADYIYQQHLYSSC